MSGCTQDENGEIEGTSWDEQDDDGDGYLNKVDDFPDDSSFHIKIEVDRFERTVYDEIWEEIELTPSIPSSIEYVFVYVDTSGNDVELELFVKSGENIYF